ncbi:MAG: hypothetical protein ACOCYU_04895 [Brevefilum sp.]
MEIQPKTYYKTKLISKITSDTLEELREQLITVSEKRGKLFESLSNFKKDLKKIRRRRKLLGWYPLKKLFKSKIDEWDEQIEDLNIKIDQDENELIECKMRIDIDINENTEFGFSALYEAFGELQGSEKIWDVTTSQKADRVTLRTTAEDLIERKMIAFDKQELDLVSCDYEALYLENANGSDIYLYPLFILLVDKKDFALIDLKDIDIEYRQTNFIETESIPEDAEVSGYTWAKANKDGSRDKRFSSNYQIPVMNYGIIYLKSKKGFNEAYMISNAYALIEFGRILTDYQVILNNIIN